MGDKVKSLQRDNDKLRDQIRNLSKDFANFKDRVYCKFFLSFV